MSMEILHVSLIPAPQYFALMEAVEALPLKKRTRWHGFVKDAQGVKHKVYFNSKDLIFKHCSIWVTLKPSGSEILADFIEYDSLVVKDQTERLSAAYKRGGHDAAIQEHSHMVDEAATGNHRSKFQKIRVPTKPGEPVRA
jgi:hypothetical protein